VTSNLVNILLVEDDPAHAEIVRRSFEVFGIANHLTHVGDGKSAVDYLQRTDPYTNDAEYPLPELILLDLRLPRIDGLEVLSFIKGSSGLRKIPVVVLTTSDSSKDIALAYDRGANSYLVKPVGFKDFCEMMDAIGDFWLAWNHCPF
jgi:CheY-like chemotaxis protein